MKLSEFKKQLETLTEINFVLPNGTQVPAHFHITEVGQIKKQFIDCGGTVRSENTIGLQLWQSVDLWHRLEPQKLHNIIELSEQKLGIGDHEIEIEYQADTIGKYSVEFNNGVFQLTATHTACLASDACGIPVVEKIKEAVTTCCTPGGGCC